ncbi:MAG: Hpt domain-containing protein [Succinivibrionaceae bacterium]
MLIDKNILKNLVADVGSEVFATLIQIYIDETNETIEKLRREISEEDFKGFSLDIHTLKSTSATYGAKAVFDLANKLNESCKLGVSMIDMKDDAFKLISLLKETATAYGAIKAEDYF